MDEDLVATAWRDIVAFLNSETEMMGRTQRSEYLDFVAITFGTERRNLDNWMRGSLPKAVLQGSDKRLKDREKVLGLHKMLSKYGFGSWRLASAIGVSLELSNETFHSLERYKGDYKQFRLGYDGLIIGNVKIDNDEGHSPWTYYHSGTDDIDGREMSFEHQGPIYCVDGRIYVAGIGSNDTECYFRTMICRTVFKPKAATTFGIILTETAETYRPISSKVAWVSVDDPRLEKEDFLNELTDRLRIESDINVRIDSA